MIPHLTTHLNTHTKIAAETDRAYANLLLHVHDPWTEHCYRCDAPGPCPLLKHWLDRLAALEAAGQALHEAEEPEGEDTP
ncbi:hypothetical protein [Phytomonospora endophytica]|uniref:Uncharacterized protein n=1 Tax=Phytomonospora endophytica TaxID=714109 RepID=A0A841FJ70_9ACTN|nr:hypothetical protein [Phytomonospora endophytica]MBB6033602.1 hypothetical protein [Phytomonospora endophytica]GIG64882.1 hypothetical protein Pen01_11770 [Phytomonospora endophytica]